MNIQRNTFGSQMDNKTAGINRANRRVLRDVRDNTKTEFAAGQCGNAAVIANTSHYATIDRKEHNITVEIKKIAASNYRSGKVKMKYGVVFQIDGANTEVHFGGTDATMIYVCTLLKKYQNEHFFLNQLKIKPKHMRADDQEAYNWVKTVYETLFPCPTRSFEEWYGKLFVATDQLPGHPIYQGKSACNRKINKEFSGCPELKSCFSLQVHGYPNNKYYELNLPPAARIAVADAFNVVLNAC